MRRVPKCLTHVIARMAIACAVTPANCVAVDDQTVYLQGVVIATNWQGSATTVTVKTAATAPPAALTRFAIPKHKPTAAIDPVLVLGTAKAPSANEKMWIIELASQATLEAWRITPMKVGETVAVVGYVNGKVSNAKTPTLLAEYLVGNGTVTPLRALPR